MTAPVARRKPKPPPKREELSCLRYYMMFSNFLAFVGGIVLISLGSWALTSTESFQMVISENHLILTGVEIIIAVGCLLTIIGFLGCCGALTMDKIMLGSFFAVILVLFVLNITSSALAFVFHENLERLALNSLSLYNQTGEPYGAEITLGWNKLQEKLECCGVHGMEDWINMTVQAPAPCSVDKQVIGCELIIKSYFLTLGAVGTVVMIAQVLSMTITCILYLRQHRIENALSNNITRTTQPMPKKADAPVTINIQNAPPDNTKPMEKPKPLPLVSTVM